MEQRQNKIAALYLEKIKQLRDILNRQATAKNELFR